MRPHTESSSAFSLLNFLFRGGNMRRLAAHALVFSFIHQHRLFYSVSLEQLLNTIEVGALVFNLLYNFCIICIKIAFLVFRVPVELMKGRIRISPDSCRITFDV